MSTSKPTPSLTMRKLAHTRRGFSRRQLLRAMGVGAAASPFVPALTGWAAPAGNQARRMLLAFSSGGMVPESFWPSGGETDFAFAPGSILEPLGPHKKDLVVINGLARKVRGVGGAHERAMGALWTGSVLNKGDQFGGGGWPSGPSVDQIIARSLPIQTDYSSLEIGVQPFGPGAKGGTMQHMCYAGSNQPIPSEASPYKLFERLFGSGPLGGSMTLDQIRDVRRSVIDVVKSEITEVQSHVGKPDKEKIEAHLEATRAIERRLQRDTPASCTIRTPTGRIDLDANENFPPLVKLQTDLLVSAFACDRTRVASLQWSRSFSMVMHTWLNITEGHHTLSHDSNIKPTLAAIARWYTEQLAYLLAELKKVPEGEGTNLLDNTLVVYCNELHTGWDHKPGPVPTILAGRLGGRLKTGRYLNLVNKDKPVTHTSFLVSLCKVMGAEKVEKLGNLDPPGALPGIFS